ncbi:hypothetical protein TNCV_1130101 [Trichonephila clavipes]|nr:hypothetical protein TNCV_1130101 [Trichonephila clavipes]
MEDELAHTESCHVPRGRPWDYITFMTNFRGVLNRLKPSEFSYFEPADLDSEFMEQEATKEKGAFVQALWTQYAIPKLYFLVYKAWRQNGAQNLTTWTRLAQAVLDGCFGQKWTDCVFQVPDSCSICLSTMHWPEKTQCGHTFHSLRCLLRHLDVSHTCPRRTPNPLLTPRHCIEPQENGRMITGKEHISGPVVVLLFFWVPPLANVDREESFLWKESF